MRTIDSHSAMNNIMQRNGLTRRSPNVEYVPAFIIHSKVCRRVKIVWEANKLTFYSKYSEGSFSRNGRYQADRLKDTLELRNVDVNKLLLLGDEIEQDGYTALETYLVKSLNIK